jgi:hypothetical protein
LEDIIAGFLGSPEYFFAQASDNMRWLDRVYQQILGHGRDSAWTFLFDQLQQGATREQVARQVLNREEYRDALIRANYTTYLNRQPDNAELDYWRDRVGRNEFFSSITQDERFQAEVLASREYMLNVADSGPAWVTSLFSRVLQQTASAESFTFWFNRLLSLYSSTRLQVAQSFDTSVEYRDRLIETTFQQYLGRSATGDELNSFRTVRTEVMRSIILSTEEYFQRQGSDNTAWLNQVYQDLLGRPRGKDGDADLEALNNGTRTRRQITDALVTGEEYRRLVVGGFYSSALGRPATDTELRLGVDRLRFGTTEERLLAEILSTTEYFLKRPPQGLGGAAA